MPDSDDFVYDPSQLKEVQIFQSLLSDNDAEWRVQCHYAGKSYFLRNGLHRTFPSYDEAREYATLEHIQQFIEHFEAAAAQHRRAGR